ncbi:MAG: bifunctional phosphopantothenoylcysteine decarboxylase/phosphopantothenate--cysteine ligase CoaBC [Desulfovibrionaceae bacterium]|nr:bifunctional phosphopantothenoylcysteine decarboxylase/phosphopantothenate--cysteine ligase CoaBC [Desulfovibrionaceae bacterium]
MGEQILFSDSTFFRGKRLHLAVTGSIACYKACDLLRLFSRVGIGVSVGLSAGARKFVQPLLFRSLGATRVYTELFSQDESPDADSFAHLEPGKIAHAMLVAPLSADMLAKLACGMADDIVSAQALAFSGPLLLAPAMNPVMWANPAVQENIAKLCARGAILIPPEAGGTACGDQGTGRMATQEAIFFAVLRALSPQIVSGQSFLLTVGPTREYWDSVRFWSNPSSGRMGSALALCAWLMGGRVCAITGPGVAFFLPTDVERIAVTNASEMHAAALAAWENKDIAICTAAVADFAPERGVSGKCKKASMSQSFPISFHRNPDILLSLVEKKREGQKIVAFAAETTPDLQSLGLLAREKRERKGADLLCANRVNSTESGFGTPQNSIVAVDAHNRYEVWERQSKSDIAWRICTWLSEL